MRGRDFNDSVIDVEPVTKTLTTTTPIASPTLSIFGSLTVVGGTVPLPRCSVFVSEALEGSLHPLEADVRFAEAPQSRAVIISGETIATETALSHHDIGRAGAGTRGVSTASLRGGDWRVHCHSASVVGSSPFTRRPRPQHVGWLTASEVKVLALAPFEVRPFQVDGGAWNDAFDLSVSSDGHTIALMSASRTTCYRADGTEVASWPTPAGALSSCFSTVLNGLFIMRVDGVSFRGYEGQQSDVTVPGMCLSLDVENLLALCLTNDGFSSIDCVTGEPKAEALLPRTVRELSERGLMIIAADLGGRRIAALTHAKSGEGLAVTSFWLR